jgi:uncharacterized protein YdbL (DUF1318 family)
LALAMLAAIGVAACLTGCSQQDAVKAAETIHTYLPAVVALANDAAAIASGLDPAEAQTVQAVSTKVQAELQELETLSGAYVAAPSGDGWTKLEAVVDALVSDADQGLLAALAIKDPASQTKAKVALSALDAAVHVLDGYLLAARTPAETQAAAAQRTVKLQSVAQYWSPRDWQRVEVAFGAPGEELYGVELRRGF